MMTLSEKILILLNTKNSRYKGVPINIFGLPVFQEYNKRSVRNAFSKLRSKNLIVYYGSSVKITKNGEKYLKRRSALFETFESPYKDNEEKNLLVLFDIPEGRKAEREWFRRHLRIRYDSEKCLGWSITPSKRICCIYKENKIGGFYKNFQACKVIQHK